MIGLDQRATVYTPDPATGAATVLARSGLACRLAIATVPQEPSEERAEIDARRLLLWEPGYVMDETAQVEIDSVRWNLRPGTLAAVRGPGGAVLYRRAEVVRAV
jgi:hypothetical protein